MVVLMTALAAILRVPGSFIGSGETDRAVNSAPFPPHAFHRNDATLGSDVRP